MVRIDDMVERTHVSLPCVVSSVPTARTFVRRRLELELELELDDPPRQVVDDVVLATSELVTNAVEHGTGAVIDVALDASADRIELSVTGPSDGIPRAATTVPPVEARRGRGLAIVTAIADGLRIERSGGTNRVVCVFVVR